MQLRLGIVEDNQLVGKTLCTAAAQVGYLPLEPVSSYDEALQMIEIQKPDLVVIDIQLEGEKNGLDLAHTLKEAGKIPFIFITTDTSKETIDIIKKLTPTAYLLKPITKEDLLASVEVCMHNFHHKPAKKNITETHKPLKDSLFLRLESSIQKVLIADILYLESKNSQVTIFTRSGNLQIKNTLQGFVRSARCEKFERVHKSYVVNIDKISRISTDAIYLDKISIPFSRLYKEKLFSKINIMQ